MIAMENKDCEKEVDVDQGWMIYFHIFLVAASLDSWAAKAVPETAAEEEERTWFIHLSKSLLQSVFCFLFISFLLTFLFPISNGYLSHHVF